MGFPWQLNAPAFKPRSFQFRATPIEVEKPNKGARGGSGRETGTHHLRDRSGRHDDVRSPTSPQASYDSFGESHPSSTGKPRFLLWHDDEYKTCRESPRFETPRIWNACAMHGKVNLLLLENNRVSIDSKTAAGEILMY
ncbi:hypothetical protein N7501_000744 [Penicillium viridicatum]|nr:hypothetical protein N7501_000744 [Penicillium viridicatum]